MAVETSRPVAGHLIITELMVMPSEFAPLPRALARMELLDRDRLTTCRTLGGKLLMIGPDGTNVGEPR